jgi:hypothetical protein
MGTAQQSSDAITGASATMSNNPIYDFYKVEDIIINQIPADENGYHYYQFTARSTSSSSSRIETPSSSGPRITS